MDNIDNKSEPLTRHIGRPKKSSDTNIRQHLMTVAFDLFAKNEYNQISTRKIAAEANTTPAMIRYYFQNKEGLFHAAMEQYRQPMVDVLRKNAANPSLQNLHDIFLLFYTAVQENQSLHHIIKRNMVSDDNPQIKAHIIKEGPQRSFKFIKTMLTKLQAKGDIKPELDPELLTIQILSLCIYPCAFKPLIQGLITTDIDMQFYHRLAQQNYTLLINSITTEKYNAEI
ncbi:TetR/AcrR family transcriptional regulator [Moritella viscosa]|uniref:Transcriptional regulator, TetR family n=1 Tax=Moritella viscosa TaxID=80854 RepID=A0A090IGV6_9GAMM|nr:TetR/AcrR family transcriptional regulator [Moritella viscosa]CED59134.1 HTH-type transcriptional regulator, TetR family [Moritella viscosa]SGY86998.1 Transcriptional regulator, TetR family [Moritella viscosa]SGZ03913.1 Transcriptional regulator, TetR family [Moritella viscosa]SGZ07515.1 Transcriptional regulator, TetR family [Moritella viscosa]SGZ18194.1 Transcriptional regulator, TetR family [Moritella viscosa]